jgi:lipid II:glycine glycyltransferase (peptidoglycan interpeptide bridge formation enzyme)
VAATLLTAAMNDGLRERWHTVEIRGPVEQQDRQGFNEVKRNDLYTLRLDRSLGDITKGFSDSVRWGRKRALRDGLRAERRWSDGALRDFYRLHQITRRKLGVPVQPWRFFRSLWSEFSPGNEAFIVQARGAGEVTASAVFLRHRQRLYYKFAASDPLALTSQPNSLILWEAIEWAHAAGLSEVDFGKTAHENAGLARFKRSWGAVPTAVSYYYFPRVTGLGAESEHSTRLRAARAVWRRLPLPAARLLGGFLYRGLA